MDTAEIIGLVATILVLISFLFKNVRTIRLISIVGCIVFVVYGIMISALSIWLLNGLLIFIHIYFLLRLYIGKTSTDIKTTERERLQKFAHKTFNKKCLREITWWD